MLEKQKFLSLPSALSSPEGYVGENNLRFVGGIQRAWGRSLGTPKNLTSYR